MSGSTATSRAATSSRARYDELLADLPVVRCPGSTRIRTPALHLYVVRLRLEAIGATQREVFERMRAAGIGVNLHYIPVYRQPYYRRATASIRRDFPEAERYYAEAITLPLYPALTDRRSRTRWSPRCEGSSSVKVAVIPARGGSKRIPRKNIRAVLPASR